MTKKIMVTGANGQLGKCLQKIAENDFWDYEFIFTTSEELDIVNKDAVYNYFNDNQPDFCINAAAYTAVDLAEQEADKAFSVNNIGVANLAEACAENKTVLIHISTDYVFDGESQISYDEDNFTNPQSIYGKSKLEGENSALDLNSQTVILRTSWLYSEFNKNFVKTMLHLFTQKDELSIVNDQYGQPTNANDLAAAIMKIITAKKLIPGVFHFSNYPETTWFHFAEKIAEFSKSSIKLKPIATVDFPTPAKRPARSTMSLDKIELEYDISPKKWEDSLEDCILNIMKT